MRSQRFCPPLLDKNGNYEEMWSNKRKSFIKPVGMNGSNFKNETLFVSFTAIITTRNGWDGKIFISEIEWLAALKCRATFFDQTFIWSNLFIVSVFVQQGWTKALTSHLFTPLFIFIHFPLIYFAPSARLLIDFKNSEWLTYFCILLCICYCFSHLIGLRSITWLSLI